MKVALVCDWYHPRIGGIELHLHDLATRLAGAGHDVVVVTPTPGPPTVDGVRVVRIEAPRAPRFGFLVTPGGIRAVGDALGAELPDIVHAHVSIVSQAAFGGAREADRRGLPLAVTFHSVVPQTRLLARAARAALGTARWRACFSAVSQRVGRDVAPIAPAQRMRILPNGIDVDFWRAADERCGETDGRSTTRLLSVMRLNPKKRPLALVQLMQRLGESNVELRIVGDGPWRAKLERAIAHAGLSNRIALLGRRSREEIRDLMSTSDVFVLPTIRESFGLAALEARCAGVPVVAMRASGVAELIEHGVHGLLADSDDDFADQVASLVRNPARREAMGAENRRGSVPFAWASVLDAHLALYADAITLRS